MWMRGGCGREGNSGEKLLTRLPLISAYQRLLMSFLLHQQTFVPSPYDIINFRLIGDHNINPQKLRATWLLYDFAKTSSSKISIERQSVAGGFRSPVNY